MIGSATRKPQVLLEWLRASVNWEYCIAERWLPIHTVETILISVISMLADPNDESPANVDAAKEWRENYPEFR